MDSELMRQFLVVLSAGKRGGKIKLHADALNAVDEKARLKFHRDGPLVVMSVEVAKDRWGRALDRCGQVKCMKCDTWINYDYPDGSKRTYCAKHESSGRGQPNG